MAQHVLLAAQLVPQYKPIRRCSNYEVLQSIPCSPECKIVPDTEDTIKFHLTLTFTYTVDMFRDTLHLPVETPENPFVAPANINTIETFMNRVGYQGVVDKVSAFYTKNLAQPWQTMFKVFNRCLTTRTSGHDQTKINILQLFHVVLNQTHVDYAALLWWDFMNNVFQKKESIQYPRFIKLIIADLMKKFPNIPKRLEEDYHSIKDDVPLVAVPMNQPQPVVSTQGTNRNTPRAPRTPTISASPQESKKRKDEVVEATILSLTLHKTALDTEAKENVAKVQEMLEQEEIDKLVDGDEDEESYASAFADSVINNDDDDTGSKLEPRSHKEHPEHVFDYDEKKQNDEEVEKEKEVVEIVKETNVEDTSAKKNIEVVMEEEVVDMSGSQEIRKEQKQTPIPSPIRSPRNDLSSDLADTVTPTTVTSSKTPSTTTHQKKSFTAKTRQKIKEVIQHYDKIVLELTVTKTNEMLKKEMPRLVKLAVNKDREVSPVDISGMVSKEFVAHGPKLIEELFQKHMQNTTLNLYPKTKSSTATTSSADLQQQLYLSMKTKPQDQAADLEI
ncbi:hypothetical protein Tco_0333152 [Tanacetum coccineum]